MSLFTTSTGYTIKLNDIVSVTPVQELKDGARIEIYGLLPDPLAIYYESKTDAEVDRIKLIEAWYRNENCLYFPNIPDLNRLTDKE